MALPKRRHSKSRRNKRRTHYKLTPTSLSLCSQCNEPKLPHHACPTCGTYRGREIIKTEEE
ncbi:MAG: 50S ribosomal protein L32 [Deltaproteobacteria bacterium]|nr:50S ribosomal protein L32 [Deltaproteobacteria bacterium]MBW2071814.1 50S ribosomal protein L32 [Deltaproteobacteria bacterium]